jgi:NAD(P)-dependent dehydrogenase (short-subunit alcohol dehydrogenase family)
MELNGKVATVTGDGSGIGYAIAQRLAGARASGCEIG